MRIALFALIATLLIAPLAAAHAAPAAREFETRALHDHNDDSAVVLAGKHGFDSIALDVREGRLPTGEPALMFRLLLNGGCKENLPDDCPTLKQVVEYTINGTPQTVTFETTDGGETWTGDADMYGTPEDINDGTRFAIEAWVAMSRVGAEPGMDLTDFFVQGHSGDSEGDDMPQGIVPGTDDPLGAAFDIGTYTIGNPDRYLELRTDNAMIQAEPGQMVEFNVSLENLVVENQIIQLAGAEFEGGVERNVSAGFTETIQATMMAPMASGPGVLLATSGLGGFSVAVIQFDITQEDVDESHIDGPATQSGASWSYTFQTMGLFEYHDHNAATNMGTVHIGEDDGTTDEHEIHYDGTAFDPASLDITLGDTVTWINDSDSAMRIMGGVGGHDHGDHDHGDDEPLDEDAPGPAVALLVAGLALIVARKSRK